MVKGEINELSVTNPKVNKQFLTAIPDHQSPETGMCGWLANDIN